MFSLSYNEVIARIFINEMSVSNRVRGPHVSHSPSVFPLDLWSKLGPKIQEGKRGCLNFKYGPRRGDKTKTSEISLLSDGLGKPFQVKRLQMTDVFQKQNQQRMDHYIIEGGWAIFLSIIIIVIF